MKTTMTRGRRVDHLPCSMFILFTTMLMIVRYVKATDFSTTTAARGIGCPEVICPSNCDSVLDEYGCRSCRCNSSCLSDGCPANEECQMMPGSCAGTSTNCPLVPTCVAMPDLICEPMVNCSLRCTNGWLTGAQGCPICACIQASTSKTTAQCQPACTGMICFYGSVKDSYGCDTCVCFDPCQAANCPDQCSVAMNTGTQQYYGNCFSKSTAVPVAATRLPIPSLCSMAPDYGMLCQQNTTRYYYNATSNACLPFTFGGCLGNDNNFPNVQICQALCLQATPTCPALPTCNFCLYGYKKDASTGCSTCQCHDPCENCTAKQTCMKMQIDCPSASVSCDGSTVLGQCVDLPPTAESPMISTSTPQHPPCPACMMYCPYGMLTDVNGCATCQCYDPCQSLYCGRAQKCQVVQNDCPSGATSCDPRVQFTGECVDLATTTTSSPTGILCPLPLCYDTMIGCQYGTTVDSNGCETCQCFQPCLGVTCNATQTCQPSPYQDCNGDACKLRYTGTCQKTPYVCPSTPNCGLSCPYDLSKDANGCSVCKCHAPCQNVTCSNGYQCQVRNDTVCTTAGCSIQFNGYCAVICPVQSQQCSQLSCEYGFNKDSNGCVLCSCNDPCANVTCQSGMYCTADTMPMFTGNPPERFYLGQCVDCNSPSCSPSLVCQYGFARDPNGCRVCQCYDPCMNMTCPSDQKCIEPSAPTTVYNPDGSITQAFIGQCVDKCFGPMCMIACMYGHAKGPDGCDVCGCYNPCQNVTCPQLTKCVPQQQTSTDGTSTYVGQCVACPSAMCSTPCLYGTPTDSQGCSTSCTCLPDPCLNTTCDSSTQVCQAVVYSPSCLSGGCSASAVCVYKTRPCNNLQDTYLDVFANDVDEMPELNCDMYGNFKPIQCFDSQCWCVDTNGKTISAKSTTVPQCYLNGQVINVLKVDANINAIQPGDGWKYKQQMSQQIANSLQISDPMVTVVKYENGSIMTEFVVGGSENASTSVVQNRLSLLANPMTVSYDGNNYMATLVGVITSTTVANTIGNQTPGVRPVTTPGIPATVTSDVNLESTATDYTLLVILLSVFIPIGVFVTVFAIILCCKLCAERRNQTKQFFNESKSSTEFNSLERGSCDKDFKPVDYGLEKMKGQATDA